MEIAAFQHAKGRYFAFEHPLYASSWASQVVPYVASLPGVRKLRLDMCMFGLQVDERGLNKKPTGILSNHPRVLRALDGHLCDGTHKHAVLEGSWQTSRAARYPSKLARRVARAAAE
eukprot:8704347-Pyramimonas_sp.AAC.1